MYSLVVLLSSNKKENEENKNDNKIQLNNDAVENILKIILFFLDRYQGL
jgi:hypothetical protein